MFCKKCGQEVAEGHEFCMSCGTPVEVQLENTQCAKFKMSKKKYIIAVSVFVSAIIIVCASALFFVGSKVDNGFYNDIPWGTSLIQVKERLTGDIKESDDGDFLAQALPNFEGKEGVYVMSGYDFENDALCAVSLKISLDDNCDIQDSAFSEMCISHFEKLYGKAKELPVQEDGVKYMYIWTAPESEIMLTYFSDEQVFYLIYSDITTIKS